ncbi:MAG TPA: helix-turn-helix domain-containing protein [Iamia sp.]
MTGPRRSTAGTDAEPRRRLVEAAERLFADQGIDRPSLAELTRAAGLGNTGAVHYYFGDREGLLDAVLTHHRDELDARREVLLDELETLGATTPETVIRVLVEPMADKLDDERGRAFLSIQAQRALRPRRRWDTPRPIAQRVHALLGHPGRVGPVEALRRDLGLDLAYTALAQRAVLEGEDGREAGVGRDEFVHQLCRAIARIQAPDQR